MNSNKFFFAQDAAANVAYLQQSEHVTASLGNGRHFSDDGKIVNDERNFILLNSGEVLGMSQ